MRMRLPLVRTARLLEYVADVEGATVPVDALYERPEAADCRLVAGRDVLAERDADVELHRANARSPFHHHQVAHLPVVRRADEALYERRLETSRDLGQYERDGALLRRRRVHDELELTGVGGAREYHRVVRVYAVAVAVDPLRVETLESHGVGERCEAVFLDAVLDDQTPTVDVETRAAQVSEIHVVSRVEVQVERLGDLVAQTARQVTALLVRLPQKDHRHVPRTNRCAALPSAVRRRPRALLVVQEYGRVQYRVVTLVPERAVIMHPQIAHALPPVAVLRGRQWRSGEHAIDALLTQYGAVGLAALKDSGDKPRQIVNVGMPAECRIDHVRL